MNKVMLIGRLGAEPDLRSTQGGSSVCTLSVATDESYTDRNGNRVDRTEWHRVVVFRKAADNCGTHLHKGSLVYVEGRLQTRRWQDRDGQDRCTTEISADRVLFLDRREEGALQAARDGGRSSAGNGRQADSGPECRNAAAGTPRGGGAIPLGRSRGGKYLPEGPAVPAPGKQGAAANPGRHPAGGGWRPGGPAPALRDGTGPEEADGPAGGVRNSGSEVPYDYPF